MILLTWLTFLLVSLILTLILLLFCISFFLLTLVFVLQWFYLHWEILDHVVIFTKGLLNPENLHIQLKQKSPSLPRNLALKIFVFNKSKSAIPPLFNRLQVLSSASDKAKLFTKNFSKNSSLWSDDCGIYFFPCFLLKEPSWICIIFPQLPRWLERS